VVDCSKLEDQQLKNFCHRIAWTLGGDTMLRFYSTHCSWIASCRRKSKSVIYSVLKITLYSVISGLPVGGHLCICLFVCLLCASAVHWTCWHTIVLMCRHTIVLMCHLTGGAPLLHCWPAHSRLAVCLWYRVITCLQNLEMSQGIWQLSWKCQGFY